MIARQIMVTILLNCFNNSNFALKGELLAKKDKLSPWQQSAQSGKCNISL